MVLGLGVEVVLELEAAVATRVEGLKRKMDIWCITYYVLGSHKIIVIEYVALAFLNFIRM